MPANTPSSQAGDRCVSILGLCNPLLDISASVETDLLSRYNLEPNNVILAGDEHKDLCSVLVDKYKVDYTAGGSAQNVMRVAAGILKKQGVNSKVMFTGAVGDDEFGRLMAKKATDDGVHVNYMIAPDTPTGTCAVLLTDDGKNRSLCAFLGACQKFNIDHLNKNWSSLVEDTVIIYITGFLIAVSLETFLVLGKHSNENNKVFCLNLSAPYISEVFGDKLLQVIPYVDIVFGNDSEAQAYARLKNWQTDNISEIAKKIAQEPKHSDKTSRTVIITQGADPIIVAYTPERASETSIREFPCEPIPKSEMIDSNGAGDAFAGGFLSQYAQQAKLERCIKVGSYAARQIIKQSGVVMPGFDDIPV